MTAELENAWFSLFRSNRRDVNVARALARLERAQEAAGTATFDDAFYEARFHTTRLDPAPALALAERELSEGVATPSHQSRARLLTGVAHARLGRLPQALVIYSDCEREARELSDTHLLLRTLTEAGRGASIRGESNIALGLIQEALDLATSREDLQAQAENLLTLGFFFGEKDEPEPYIRHTRAALALFEVIDEPLGKAMSHCNIAGGLSRLERFDEARTHYARSRELANEHGLEFVLALCLAGEGGIHCRTGDLERGRDCYLESNALMQKLGRTFQVVRHLHLLGSYFLLAERHEDARRYLEEAAVTGRAHSFRSTLGQTLDQLSQTMEKLGDLEAALRYLRERCEVQQVDFEGALASKVELLNQRHQLEIARREAERGRLGNEELRRVNAQLVEALARQQELQDELKRLSETDPLTGLSNRRHLRATLDRELIRITRMFRPLTILLLDVDRFKLVNDGHGHAVGDEVLVELARRLRAVTREADSVGRWGGEEFCIALHDTDLLMSRRPAEAVLEAVRATPFATRAGPVSVTVSIGVASLSIDRFDVDELMSEADSALYLAKSRGRNRIVYSGEEVSHFR